MARAAGCEFTAAQIMRHRRHIRAQIAIGRRGRLTRRDRQTNGRRSDQSAGTLASSAIDTFPAEDHFHACLDSIASTRQGKAEITQTRLACKQALTILCVHIDSHFLICTHSQI